MTTKYTPAPWAVHGEWIIRADIIAESEKNEHDYHSGNYIAHVAEPFGGETVRKANAQLIAGAPTMYTFICKLALAGDESAKSMLDSLQLTVEYAKVEKEKP